MTNPILSVRQLFGGAIVSYVPPVFEDISNVRDIPDYQEVFADTTTDQSISFDILQLEENVADEHAAAHHFNQLSEDNKSNISNIHSITPLSQADLQCLPLNNERKGYLLLGTQQVSKFNETALNQIGVLMAVLRLRDVGTDLVITYNIPVQIADGSSSRSVEDANVGDPNIGIEEFRSLLRTFQIIDWDLFVN